MLNCKCFIRLVCISICGIMIGWEVNEILFFTWLSLWMGIIKVFSWMFYRTLFKDVHLHINRYTFDLKCKVVSVIDICLGKKHFFVLFFFQFRHWWLKIQRFTKFTSTITLILRHDIYEFIPTKEIQILFISWNWAVDDKTHSHNY